MFLAAASEKVTSVQDAAGYAAAAIVKDSVFGALLLGAVMLLVWLVRRVLAVQDARVADQKQMSERLEKAQDRQGQLIEKMTEAFSAFKGSVDSLIQAQESGRNAITELNTSVQQLRTTMDSVIRDAVRRGSGSSGRYGVVRTEIPPVSTSPRKD